MSKEVGFEWKFIGLSSDNKPTVNDCPDLADGATFWESDTSKGYVYYDGQWYEKKNTGGGGGGGTGTDNYNELSNLPKINNVQLNGNKTSSDLSLVSSETGKGLSSNDFTNEDKAKLDGIEAGATKTTLDSALSANSSNPVKNKVITAALADKADKSELPDMTNYYDKTEADSLLGSKQATLVSGTNIKTINNESILGDGNLNVAGGTSDFNDLNNRPQYNGSVMTNATNIPEVPTTTSELTNDSGFITKDVNDLTNYTKSSDITTALDDKVDKVTGKGLSTNDFTTADKTKLDGIETGAEVNTIETIKVNDSPLTPDANKSVNVVTLQMQTDDYDNSIAIDDGTGNNSVMIAPNANGADIYNTINGNTATMSLASKDYVDNHAGATYTAGDGIDITNNEISVESNIAKQVELTQAQYNALSQAEKTNGTIYFITDASASGLTAGTGINIANETVSVDITIATKAYVDDKSVFVINLSAQDQVIESYADISAARTAKRDFVIYGSGGNPTKVTGLFLQNDGLRNYIRIYGWFSYQLRYWDVYEDGTKTASTVLDVIEDTGWQTLTGDYFDINYRKKNGIVYVTWNQTSGVKQAFTAKTPVTNCTLPAGTTGTGIAYNGSFPVN